MKIQQIPSQNLQCQGKKSLKNNSNPTFSSLLDIYIHGKVNISGEKIKEYSDIFQKIGAENANILVLDKQIDEKSRTFSSAIISSIKGKVTKSTARMIYTKGKMTPEQLLENHILAETKRLNKEV